MLTLIDIQASLIAYLPRSASRPWLVTKVWEDGHKIPSMVDEGSKFVIRKQKQAMGWNGRRLPQLSYRCFSDIAPFCSSMPALTVACLACHADSEDTLDSRRGHVTQGHAGVTGPKPVPSSCSRTVMLQCPFCLKPFKSYHSLQRHASRLSQTAADEGRHCWKLPRVGDIAVLPDRTAGTVEGEPESKRQVGHSSMSARLRTADVLRPYRRSTGEQSACISSSWSRLLLFA